MTWKALARENLVAAKSLSQDARWRSAISRAYYSAYAGVCEALEGLADYPKGRFGPSHDVLPKLIMTYLTIRPVYERRRIATAAHRLYQRRVVADYRPLDRVDATLTRDCIQDASLIVKAVQS